jgi:hypothetical protein
MNIIICDEVYKLDIVWTSYTSVFTSPKNADWIHSLCSDVLSAVRSGY